MSKDQSSIWFREVHAGKWVPVNAKGYAAMVLPILALLAVTLVPPALVDDDGFSLFWLFGSMIIGMPLCLFVIFRLARRHSAPSRSDGRSGKP